MKLKYIIPFILTLFVSLYFLLEVVEDKLVFYMFTCMVVPVGIVGLVFKNKILKIFVAISAAMLLSWAVFYPVYRYQSSVASETIKSISVENLKKFAETGDINVIPKEKQTVWIGFKEENIKKITKKR